MSMHAHLNEAFQTEGVRAVIGHLWQFARRYGDIKHWRFYGGPNGTQAFFYLKLDDATQHHALAEALGGEVAENEVCVTIDTAPCATGSDKRSTLA